ncbi:MAG: chromosome segregation protein SMC [Planctomycetes bacterium]|nr:chromosome segregation protein SMC [Planctomycetota bacterium]
MRLKRLVARGFKSFADRTEFEFDNRLTGIIGPNGCGKSNVVDAIKWVLGDQRAKSLRGNEMTDVIFKGAEGRDPMGLAEVTITFEDPEGRVDGRGEVDIARRLTLDKESSYLLNGQEVRLKDVRDVLLDTGLGTGGYSVMEQGRIDAVLSANPEARRAIFEEAAGVARFKLQKKEALRKLERTDQNLARVTDLLEERARRIRSLRIQAGKARRFQVLQASLRELRAALAVIDGRALRDELAAQARCLQEAQAELGAAEAGRDAAAAELEAADAAIAACTGALERVQEEVRACRGELTTHRGRADAQGQRAADLLAELDRGRLRAGGLQDQREERAAALTVARDGLASKEAELVQLHKQLEHQRRDVQAAAAALRALQQEREQVRERQLELLHGRARARNAAADATARIGAAKARELRLTERRAALAAEGEGLAAEAQQLRAGLVDVATKERILQEREQQALGDLQGADAAAAELAQRESQLRLELSQVDGRRQALLAMEAHMEGLDEAPRHVLQQRPDGLRGRLLDLIEIDLQHGQALEAALGPYVQALVVDTREHAAAIVRDLADRRLGRVLLLVEQEFGEAPPCRSGLLSPPPGAHYLTDLVRHVATDSASERLLGWLLRGVVLAGFDLADPTRADLCFVTPDGTLVCGPRLEGGAAAEGHAGLVVRRSQIAELCTQVAAVQARLADLQAGKDAVTGRVDALKRELKAVGEALQAVRGAAHAAQGQLGRIQARTADLDREVGELGHEGGELSRTRCGALAQLGAALFDQFLLAGSEARFTAAEGDLSGRIAAAESTCQAAQRAEQELRIGQVQAGEAREGALRAIAMHEQALRDLERALQELHDRQRDAEDDRARAIAEQARLGELAAAFEDQLAALSAARLERQVGLDAARQQRARVQQEVHGSEQRRAAANEALTQTRLQAADLDHRFARLEDRLREETGVELRRCLGEVTGVGLVADEEHQGPPAPPGLVDELQGPPLPPAWVQAFRSMRRLWQHDDFDAADARREVQVLQSQKDRLGAVNLDAVQELDDEEGQFSTLEQEVGDLKEARRALLDTLRKLEAESKLLFEHTFDAARKNFQEIFRKLFQGGKADMFLTNLEDLLEAGIEIVAQPPGKQLQSINLLSGGERSLTAVAILFALFKVRPSPFCILDEVDAALDETNVERFLRVLRDFTHGTQFCIVTHHKRTMAECQVLYGITMQRRGVSSRIAVSLQEVDSFQGSAADAGRPDPAGQRRVAGEEPVGFA